MRAPCKDCPDRWAECHANCEKWAEYEKKRDAEKSGDGTPIIIWELSEREKDIIKRLGRQSNGNTEAKNNKNSRF